MTWQYPRPFFFVKYFHTGLQNILFFFFFLSSLKQIPFFFLSIFFRTIIKQIKGSHVQSPSLKRSYFFLMGTTEAPLVLLGVSGTHSFQYL